MTEDEMVGWHHRLSGHEFQQALGDDGGQGSLACCGPGSHKELDTTEQLNNNPPNLGTVVHSVTSPFSHILEELLVFHFV